MADEGPLTIDQAVGVLDQAGVSQEPQASQPQPAATPVEPELQAGTREGESTGDAAEATGETQEPAEPSTAEPRNPPSHWNAEERAIFAKQPPEVQDAILAQEGKRESVTQRAKQEAQAAAQAAKAKEAEWALRAQAIDAFLPKAVQTFQNRWANVDWTTLSDQVGAEQALKFRAQFESERDQVQRLSQEQARIKDEEERQFLASESEKLKTEAPDLVDAKEGPARLQNLGRFLVSEGFTPDRIKLISAKEAAIAYDAMRWREAQRRAASPNKPSPAPSTAQPRQTPAGVRPSAVTTQRNPQSARLQTLMNKSRLTIAEATELQNLRSPATG